MSLQVKINSKAVRLPEGFELAINLKNNLLDGDREDATYPMEVNLASNRQVFGFVDRTHTDMTEKLQAGVSFGPYQLLNGQCVLTDVGDGNVEFYISTEKNSFWGKARDWMLDESCRGQFTYSPGNIANTLEQFYKSLKERMDYVVCPVRDSYIKNSLDTEVDFYNYLEPGEEYFSLHYQVKPIYFTPFLRVTVVVKRVLESMGYTIGVDEFSSDENLKDLLIICRRNPIDMNRGSEDADKYRYGEHLPRISVYDFLREIENKFGYNFIVDETTKNVDIRRLNLSLEKEVKVLDGVAKHFLSDEDRVTGIIYKDASSNDELVKSLEYFLSYVFGEEEDAETVECISTIVGVASDVKTFVRPNVKPDYKYEYRFAAFQEEFGDGYERVEQVSKELRFSIYRGMIKSVPVDGSGRSYEFYYPVASPIAESDGNGTFSLLWNGVDDGLSEYVKERALLLIGAEQHHEFYVCPDIKNLDNLQDFFSCVLVIRNRRYMCYEQEIVLNGNSIVSHLVRCYPL
jgi:hypothetical protein